MNLSILENSVDLRRLRCWRLYTKKRFPVLHRNKYNKKGFTLVELMVVLAIMGILAALVGFGLTGYIRLARFERNESNARTIFQTAQIALTRKDTTGELDTFRTDVQDTYGVRGTHFSAEGLGQLFPNESQDALTEKLNTYNKSILALYYDQNDPDSASSQFVKDLLSPYVYDESLFSASICLEIDTVSGQVYSAFYDSNADKLRFDGDAGAEGATSITDRSYDHRRNDSLVGYYSAEDTVNVVTLSQTRLKVKNPLLINNETLTLNWSGNSKHGDMDTVYDAVFIDKTTGKYLFKLEISWTDALLAGQDSNAPIKVYKPKDGYDEEGNLQWQDTSETYDFPLSYSKGRFILTLDAMCDATLQRAAENEPAVMKKSLYSITRLRDGARDVYVEMKARPLEDYADSYTESKPQTSNIENTLFAAGSSSEKGTGTLKYFRHLYNLRYVGSGTYSFANSGLAGKATLNWTDGSVTVYCADKDGGKPVPKVPSRTGEAVPWPTITTLREGVTLDGNGATISNLQLRGSSIAAKPRDKATKPNDYDHYVGLIGENQGTVQKLTLQDPDVQVNGEFKAAGQQDTDAMAVDADNTLYLQPVDKNSTEYRENVWSVGALAGMDSGTLTDCTIKRSNGRNAAARVGAVLPFDNKTIGTKRADGTQADGKKENKTDIYDEPRGIGGLVGFAMPKTNQTLTGLTVEANVTVAGLLQDTSAQDNQGTTDKLTADAAEKQRYNAIADEGKDNGHSLWRSVGVGGVAGVLDAANLTVAEGADTQKLDATNRATVVGNAFAGGIAGNLYTSIQNRNADRLAGLTNEGTVLAGANYQGSTAGQSTVLGQFFGGIAGYAKDVTLDKCTSVTRSGLSDATLTTLVQNGYNADGTLKDSSPLKGDFVGGLVGFGRDISMNNCRTQGGGYVLGRSFVGGLVGGFVGSDLRTTGGTNNSSVFGNRYVGGIVSVNGYNSTIDSLTNTGLVAGLGKNAAYVGGIAGVNDASWGAPAQPAKDAAASLLDCTNSMAAVGATDQGKLRLLQNLSTYGADGAAHYADFVGGIAGVNGSKGHIGWGVDANNNPTAAASDSKKITLGAVLYGGSYVGGVAGYNTTDATIKVGYNATPEITGAITATGSCVGGLVGLNCASALPAVTMNITQIEGMYYVGGILGANLPESSFAFVDHEGKSAAPVTGSSATILADGVAGGIIGYNQLLNEGTVKSLQPQDTLAATLAQGLLPDTTTIANGLTPRVASSGSAITLTGLTNRAKLKTNAYVGGILGYNAAGTKLTLAGAVNGSSANVQNDGYLSQGAANEAANGARYALTNGVAMTVAGETTRGYFAGGIIGYACADTTLENCQNYGGIAHNAAAGGLAGVNDGTITGGSMKAQTMGSQQDGYIFLGGIAGINNGRIENATVSAGCSIRGGKYIGGVAGYNAKQEGDAKGVILLMNASGKVGGITATGGVAGENDGLVLVKSVRVAVSGTDQTGGIAGVNTQNGVITGRSELSDQIYSTTIEADTTVISARQGGGAVGVNYGKIDDVYNKAGSIQVTDQYAGGIAGYNYGTITYCFHQANGSSRYVLYASNGYAGGIAGCNKGQLEGVYTSSAKVTAANGEAGGITAHNYGTISTATVRNATVSGNSDAIGAVTACNEAGAVIEGARLRTSSLGATVLNSPAACVGGLAGYNAGTLKNSGVDKESLSLSGLTGDKNTVSLGGAVGKNDGTVGGENASDAVTVELDIQQNMDKYLNLGGVAGVNNGTLEKCTYTGKLGTRIDSGAAAVGSTVGGIVGYNRPADSQYAKAGTVKDCTVPYIELQVHGASNIGSSQAADAKLANAAHIGGVAGRNDGSLESCTVGSANQKGSIITARHGFVGGVAGSNSGSIKNCGGDGTQELVDQINTWLQDVYVKDESGKDTTTLDTAKKNANLNQMVRVLTDKASGATETAWAGKFTAMKGIDNVSYKGATNQLTVTLQGGNQKDDFANGYLGGVTGFNSVSGQITDSASGQWFVYANNINQNYGAVGGIIGQNESNAATNSGLVNFAAVRRFVRGDDNTADDDANSGNDRYVKTERDTKADNYVGGVIGTQSNTMDDRWTLDKCVNLGTVFNSRSNNIGGVLAFWKNYGGTLQNCFNFGTLTTNSNNGTSSGTVGGVVGYFDKPVSGTAANLYKCYNYGSVNTMTFGANDVGGVFGKVQMSTETDPMTINIVECVNGNNVKLNAKSMAVGIFSYIGPYTSVPNVEVNIDRCRNYCYNLIAEGGTTAGIFGNRGDPSAKTSKKTTISNCFTLYGDNSGTNQRAITYSWNKDAITGWNNYYMDTKSFLNNNSSLNGLNKLTRTAQTGYWDGDNSGADSERTDSFRNGQWTETRWRSEEELDAVKGHRLYAGVDTGANAEDGSNQYSYFGMLPVLSNGKAAVSMDKITSSNSYITLLDKNAAWSSPSALRVVVNSKYNKDTAATDITQANGYVGQLLLLFNEKDSGNAPSFGDITDETLQSYYTNILDAEKLGAPQGLQLIKSGDTGAETVYGRYTADWSAPAQGSASYYKVRVFQTDKDGKEIKTLIDWTDVYETRFTFEGQKNWSGTYINVEVEGVNSKGPGASTKLTDPVRAFSVLYTPELEVRLMPSPETNDSASQFSQKVVLKNAQDYEKLVTSGELANWTVTVTMGNDRVTFRHGDTEPKRLYQSLGSIQHMTATATTTDTDNWMRSSQYSNDIYAPVSWGGNGDKNAGLAEGTLTAEATTKNNTIDDLVVQATLGFKAKIGGASPVYRVMLLGCYTGSDRIGNSGTNGAALKGQYITLAARQMMVTSSSATVEFANLPDDTLSLYSDLTVVAVPVTSGLGDVTTRWDATEQEVVDAINSSSDRAVAWYSGLEIVRESDGSYSYAHLTPLYFANTSATGYPDWAGYAKNQILFKKNLLTVAAAPKLLDTADRDETLLQNSNQLAYIFHWTQPDETDKATSGTARGQSTYNLTLYGQTLDENGDVLREEVITQETGIKASDNTKLTYDKTENTYNYTLNVDTDLAANSWRFDKVRLRVTRVPSGQGTVGAADSAVYKVMQRLPQVGQPDHASHTDTSNAEQTHYEISWSAVADTDTYQVDHYRLYAQQVDENGNAIGKPFELSQLDTDEKGDPKPITSAQATVNLEDHQGQKLKFYVVAYPKDETKILHSPNGEASSAQTIVKRTEAPTLSNVSFTWPTQTASAAPLMKDFCQNLTIRMGTDTTAAGYFFTGYLFSDYNAYKTACDAANTWMQNRNTTTLAALNAALAKGTCLVPENSRSEGSEAKAADGAVTYTVTPSANGFTMQPDNANQYLLPALRAMVASGTSDSSSSTWTFFVPTGYDSGNDKGLHLPKIKLDEPMQGVASSTSVHSTAKGKLYDNNGNPWDMEEYDIGITQYAVQWSAVNEYTDADNTLRNYADTYQFHVAPADNTDMNENDPNRNGYDVKFTVYTQDEYGTEVDAEGNPVIEHYRGEIKQVEKRLYNENNGNAEPTDWFDITDTAVNETTDDGTDKVLYDLSATRQDKVDENNSKVMDDRGNVITEPVSHPITLKGNYAKGSDRPQYQADTVPTLCVVEMADKSIGYRVTLPDMVYLADQDDGLASPDVYTKSVEVWAVGNGDKTLDSEHLTVPLRNENGQSQLTADTALPVVESAPEQDTPAQTQTPAPEEDTPADTAADSPAPDAATTAPDATAAPDAPAESPAPTTDPDAQTPAGEPAADSGSTPAPDASSDAAPEPTPEPPAETTAPAA